MDKRTHDYYDNHADKICERYNHTSSPAPDWLLSWIPKGSRVLDVGAGSGRDVHALLAAGFDAYGIEPVAAMRRQANKAFPEIMGRIVDARLPELLLPFEGHFDAILCTAVLMHLEGSQIFDSFLAIKRRLSPGGYLFLSLSQGREGLDIDRRDPDGRLFQDHSGTYIRLLLERLGFRECQSATTVDSLGRSEITWQNFVFQLRSHVNSRPIDQLEGVLNNDRKDATYKLALIRALADIATFNHSGVRWDLVSKVGVPMDLLIDRWIGYYWPLIESERFIPQRQSEDPDKEGQIAFRQDLLALVNRYRLAGSYGYFLREVNLPDPPQTF